MSVGLVWTSPRSNWATLGRERVVSVHLKRGCSLSKPLNPSAVGVGLHPGQSTFPRKFKKGPAEARSVGNGISKVGVKFEKPSPTHTRKLREVWLGGFSAGELLRRLGEEVYSCAF